MLWKRLLYAPRFQTKDTAFEPSSTCSPLWRALVWITVASRSRDPAIVIAQLRWLLIDGIAWLVYDRWFKFCFCYFDWLPCANYVTCFEFSYTAFVRSFTWNLRASSFKSFCVWMIRKEVDWLQKAWRGAKEKEINWPPIREKSCKWVFLAPEDSDETKTISH